MPRWPFRFRRAAGGPAIPPPRAWRFLPRLRTTVSPEAPETIDVGAALLATSRGRGRQVRRVTARTVRRISRQVARVEVPEPSFEPIAADDLPAAPPRRAAVVVRTDTVRADTVRTDTARRDVVRPDAVEQDVAGLVEERRGSLTKAGVPAPETPVAVPPVSESPQFAMPAPPGPMDMMQWDPLGLVARGIATIPADHPAAPPVRLEPAPAEAPTVLRRATLAQSRRLGYRVKADPSHNPETPSAGEGEPAEEPARTVASELSDVDEDATEALAASEIEEAEAELDDGTPHPVVVVEDGPASDLVEPDRPWEALPGAQHPVTGDSRVDLTDPQPFQGNQASVVERGQVGELASRPDPAVARIPESENAGMLSSPSIVSTPRPPVSQQDSGTEPASEPRPLIAAQPESEGRVAAIVLAEPEPTPAVAVTREPEDLVASVPFGPPVRAASEPESPRAPGAEPDDPAEELATVESIVPVVADRHGDTFPEPRPLPRPAIVAPPEAGVRSAGEPTSLVTPLPEADVHSAAVSLPAIAAPAVTPRPVDDVPSAGEPARLATEPVSDLRLETAADPEPDEPEAAVRVVQSEEVVGSAAQPVEADPAEVVTADAMVHVESPVSADVPERARDSSRDDGIDTAGPGATSTGEVRSAPVPGEPFRPSVQTQQAPGLPEPVAEFRWTPLVDEVTAVPRMMSIEPQAPVAIRIHRQAPVSDDFDSAPVQRSVDAASHSTYAPTVTTRRVPALLGELRERINAIELTDVRVLRGPAVSARARRLGARAFAQNGDVHLPDEAGPLDSPETRALLVHELTHVAQQRALGGVLPSELSEEGRLLEAQAVAAEVLARGGSADQPELVHLIAPAPRAPSFPDTPGTPGAGTDPVVASWSLPDIPGFGEQDDDGPTGEVYRARTSVVSEVEDVVTGEPVRRITVTDGQVTEPDSRGAPELAESRQEVLVRASSVEEIGEKIAENPPRHWVDLNLSQDMELLAAKLYDRLHHRLRSDVLVHRERTGTLMDFR